MGTIYNSIAQRLADGLLPDPTPRELRSGKPRKPLRKTQPKSTDRYHLNITSAPSSR